MMNVESRTVVDMANASMGSAHAAEATREKIVLKVSACAVKLNF